jgi:hypothetical protein
LAELKEGSSSAPTPILSTDDQRFIMKKFSPRLVFFILAAAVLALVGFELFFRLQIARSDEFEWIRTQVSKHPSVTQLAGNISSLELSRSMTSYHFGTQGSNGCFHLIVVGSKGTKDFLVTWHRVKPEPLIELDKIEVLSNFQREVVWQARK